MADGDGEGEANEKLLQSHRAEKKNLQAKVQDLKHSVPKGDKRRKKEIMDEIAALESELAARHSKELTELQNQEQQECEIEEIIQNLNETSILNSGEDNDLALSTKISRATKAQRRREKKEIKTKEREERIAQQEKENAQGLRQQEIEKLLEILVKGNLHLHEVPSDGNCLYKAVEHQLGIRGIQVTVDNLRSKTAEYMLLHPEDFIPFLTSQKTGDNLTSGEYEEYCKEIETTSVWGGQLELRALSHIWKNLIEVIQADGPAILIGEEYAVDPLRISYHRHEYGLGEHYNSVVSCLSEEITETSL